RKECLATLERARGETAALRHLANAASLFEKNPALMTLRAIQALHATSGNTVVLNLGPDKPPVQ
ncbi:MAG: slipin family protein, partial [FCB group bacterium]|nr:slipin family protein [FCB group bacterium]